MNCNLLDVNQKTGLYKKPVNKVGFQLYENGKMTPLFGIHSNMFWN